MTDMVYACDPANIDPNTQTCTTGGHWVQQSSMLPPLDASGGMAIGVAILGVWALAYMYKRLRGFS